VRELSLVAIVAVAVAVFSLLVDDYLSGRFFNRLTASVAITALLAAAQTVVILTRNIDLSVGSVVGVTAYLTGEFLGANQGTPAVLAVGIAIMLGCGLGLLNGVLVAYGRIPSIIVTLGTLAIFRSWLIAHAEARTITAGSLPQWVLDVPQRTWASLGDLDIRLSFGLAVVVVIVLQLALASLRGPRRLYAIGSNPGAARQAGLPVQRITVGAFALSGALAGLAGFLFLSRFGTINVDAGTGLELASVAAAVVGGVSILGGSGTLVGALFGAVLIGLLDQSLLRVPQVSQFWRDALLGALILLAVASDLALGQRLRRLWASESRLRLSSRTPADQGDPTDA
jgi:rhamnose transport system permease protein